MTRGEVDVTDDDAVAWAELDLDAGETITCTLTNVRSSLVVERQARSDPNRKFEFIVFPVEANNHVETMVEIDSTFDLSHGKGETRYVGPGSYLVGEEPPRWLEPRGELRDAARRGGRVHRCRRRRGARREGDVRLHEHAPDPADPSSGNGPDDGAGNRPL